MLAPSELMRQVASRLRDKYHVDAELDDVIRLHGSAGTSDLVAAHAAVGKRIRALQSAWNELRQLLTVLAELRALARFSAAGWPERRSELAEACAEDGIDGLAMWLSDWCQAAAEARPDALERLVTAQLPIPVGARQLVERFATAQRALAQRRWDLARPVLRVTAEGLSVGDALVTPPEIREELLLLLARIAVDLREDPAAELKAARGQGAGMTEANAIQAWYARTMGRPGEAAANLAEARGGAPSWAVLPEAVQQARDAGDALAVARARVDALGTILDIVSQLDRLIQPVPAEVWLAVAERAADSQDGELAELALSRAESAAGGDSALMAETWKCRARLIAGSGADQEKRADALLAEADNRTSAGQADDAMALYQEVLELRPNDATAALSLAASRAWRWWDKPTDESAAHIAAGIAEIEALLAEHGVTIASAWSLVNVGRLHIRLASAGERPAADHAWRGILTIARTLCFSPRVAEYWVQLSDALATGGLYRCSASAAARAHVLSPGEPQTRALVGALIDVGDSAGAHDLLASYGDSPPPWVHAGYGYLYWRQGRKEDAIDQLRNAVAGEPELIGAPDLLMQAYVLTGQGDLARATAKDLEASHSPWRELTQLVVLADAALTLGEVDKALQLGRELSERQSTSSSEAADGLAAVGAARLLGGDAAGLADLIGAVGLTRSPTSVSDWPQTGLPFLRALAAERGVELPDLAPLQEAIDQRMAILSTWADPLVELAEAPSGPADQQVVAQARGLVKVLICEAQDDPQLARAALADCAASAQGVPEWPILAERILRRYTDDCLVRGDLDAALAAEQERSAIAGAAQTAARLADIAQRLSLAGRQDDAERAAAAAAEQGGEDPNLTRLSGDILWRRGRHEAAAAVWESARAAGAQGLDTRLAAWLAPTDRPTAVTLLRAALAHSYVDTATHLRDLLADANDIESVIGALKELAADADTAIGAMVAVSLLSALPERMDPPAKAIEVHLPPSWFAGMTDPVVESPLLARYIPEIRLRLSWTLPGVTVRPDEGLNPDRYRIVILDITVEEGSVPGGAEYVPVDAVPLLSSGQQVRVTENRLMGMIRLRPAEEPATGVDAMLIVPAAEMVARRIEAVAETFQAPLKQFWSDQSP